MDVTDNQRAFASFRVLNQDAEASERDHLMRNLAQLFAYVSDRCDDEQVAQYDEVLCQLADMVEVEARAHVAGLLAPLERAPGAVVVKLANDVIEVARPLLEFSSVLSDDDLIEIAQGRSEQHRVAIASRGGLAGRVGDAIISHGGPAAVLRLVRNKKAELTPGAVEHLARRADRDAALAEDLRGRGDLDWPRIRAEIARSGGSVLRRVEAAPREVSRARVEAVVYNRLRNQAGFSASEWKLAWNQVKALADRRQFDERALRRFARFGYGHHAAAGLTMLLGIRPETMVKWLAMQDYVALTVAARAIGLSPDLFAAVIETLPWRDTPSRADIANVGQRFEALAQEEAGAIFETWRSHAFRRRGAAPEAVVA